MASFVLSLRISDFVNAVVLDLPTQKKGVTKKHICIPIDENFFFEGKGGVYYTTLIAWENIDHESGKTVRSQYGYTHSLRKDVPIKVREEYNNTEQLRKLTPYVGNMKPLSRKEQPVYPTGDTKPRADIVDKKAAKKMQFDPEDLPY